MSLGKFQITWGHLLISVLPLVAFGMSICMGPTVIRPGDIWPALFDYNTASDTQFVVRELRLPRTILAALIGASLAISGAIMQGITRNPLAGPATMGLSAGGTLAMLLGLILLPHFSYLHAIACSFAGTLLGFLTVHAVALFSGGRFTPVSLTLAGTVVSAICAAIIHGLTIYFTLHDELLYWTVGGIAHVTWQQVWIALPLVAIGILAAFAIAPSMTLLSLGQEVATGLGQHVVRTKVTATLIVLLLTGTAVAVTGPVAFVGVMTPHIARALVGADYRRIVPASLAVGASITMLADVAARGLVGGEEMPLGLFTMLVGAPVFVYLINCGVSNRRLAS